MELAIIHVDQEGREEHQIDGVHFRLLIIFFDPFWETHHNTVTTVLIILTHHDFYGHILLIVNE